MASGTRLVSTIQTIAQSPANGGKSTDFVMGTVMTVNPLSIKVGNLILPEDFLMVSPFCVQVQIDLTHNHEISAEIKEADLGSHQHSVTVSSSTYSTTETDLGTHTHEAEVTSSNGLGILTLWRGLQVGDNVLMLRGAGGQKYYVLQRQEGIK